MQQPLTAKVAAKSTGKFNNFIAAEVARREREPSALMVNGLLMQANSQPTVAASRRQKSNLDLHSTDD